METVKTLGAQATLTKPVSTEELETAVNRALTEAQPAEDI